MLYELEAEGLNMNASFEHLGKFIFHLGAVILPFMSHLNDKNGRVLIIEENFSS